MSRPPQHGATKARRHGDVPTSALLVRGVSLATFGALLPHTVPAIARAAVAWMSLGTPPGTGALVAAATLFVAPWLAALVVSGSVSRGWVPGQPPAPRPGRHLVEVLSGIVAACGALIVLALDAPSLPAAADPSGAAAVTLRLSSRAVVAAGILLVIAGFIDLALDHAAWLERWSDRPKDDGERRGS